MRKLTSYAVAVLFLAQFLNAADVSGKWSGSLEGKGEDGSAISVPARMEFKQTGEAITGSVGKDSAHEYAINKGKIADDQITFEFTAPEGDEDSAFIHRVKLAVVSEGRLEGELQFEVEGNKVAAKLKLTRDK
ncbi:MAG TPA: hypothetical protein VGP62_21215 [Bryobacteraceae bacterium]|nr:hypothetical protein [Bryobacteraceae bacterium]